MAEWVPSPNFSKGRPGPIRWVVWHDTEGQETNGSAHGIAANWFGITSSQVSAHVVVDADVVVECVKPEDTAWHCGPKGNGQGYGIEIVGRADQSPGQWADYYSLRALRRAAEWVRSQVALQAIPPRFLTDDELRAGLLGHITHAQVSRVLGGTTHTDPGPNFPFVLVTSYLSGGSPVNWTDKVIPDYASGSTPPPLLQADVTLGWTAQHAGDAASTAHRIEEKVDALADRGALAIDYDKLAGAIVAALLNREKGA